MRRLLITFYSDEQQTMDKEYAKTMVDHLYDEGDRDIIFYGFIIGVDLAPLK